MAKQMLGHTSLGARCLGVVLGVIAVAVNSCLAEPVELSAAAGDGQLLTALRQDAQLHDVFFVDPARGWAVGDRGAIWRTLDGGRHWSLQDAQVDCPLKSVFFLNEKTGWAAGGSSDPYTQTTHGVLLRTDDGGHTWSRWKRALLPALREVKFVSPQEGWAIGQTSDLFPHGLFTTDDGGRTWTPVAPADGQIWLTGDFLDPLAGAVAGRFAALGNVSSRRVAAARPRVDVTRDFLKLRLNQDGTGCTVGEGGLVLTTGDVGRTWTNRSRQLINKSRLGFDFHAVALHGSQIWVAGSPGNTLFHSPDAGHRWQALATGQSLPLYALHFVDQDHGWAVGALGTILASRDGGRSWQLQRAGGRRAAWLAVFPDESTVPLELLAKLSAADGYLGALMLIGRSNPRQLSPSSAFRDERVREALVAAGASSGLHFGWRRADDDKHPRGAPAPTARSPIQPGAAGNADLPLQLIQQFRIWQPDVIITVPASPRGENPTAHAINQAVLHAARLAGDDLQPGTLDMELDPWQVKKIYAVLPDRALGTVSVTSTQLIPSAGRSLAEYVARSRGIIHDAYLPPPTVTRFQLLANQLPQGQGQRDFFSGLSWRHGSEARRAYVKPADADINLLRRSAARQQMVQAIIASAAGGQAPSARLLAQINNLTGDMRAEAAADVLLDLATRFARLGQWSLATETYQLLVERHPSTPQAVAAMMQLVRLSGSAELQHTKGPLEARTVAATALDLGQPDTGFSESGIQQTKNAGDESGGSAIRWGRRLQDTDYMAFSRSPVRLALASAYHRVGDVRQARRIWLGMQRSRNTDAWRNCAAAELWLTEAGQSSSSNTGAQAIELWPCRSTAQKPRLDGNLDDACWQPAADAAEKPAGRSLSGVGSDRDTPATRVQLAYDQQFLYVAAVCTKASGVDYSPSDGPRPRDAPLQQHDRLDVLLDVDRDRNTYYQLTIDHRGWTAEACCGSAAWNPQWYVAASAHSNSWTCEVAIPFDQLVAQSPNRRDVWALGLQRTVPGIGLQSWTTPASADIMPEGFGYLRFE